MPNYRITFTDGPCGDNTKSYDVKAVSSDEAFSMAYCMPEAKQHWKYSDVNVAEIKKGPKTIGVQFNYTQADHPYCQYLFIKAENEEQAAKYYREHLYGLHFWQPWPHKPDDAGNCVYGGIKNTYFASGDGYDFDATI